MKEISGLRVAVIGGGIQGIGIALELSMRGASVDLFEKRDACLTQASVQNEGKIHLGFVYAKDRTLATARLMAEGALQFESILRRWFDGRAPTFPISSPFCYLVHRDSLVSVDELASYYAAVTNIVREVAVRPGASYFGLDACAAVERLPRDKSVFASDHVDAVFQTPEIALDPEA